MAENGYDLPVYGLDTGKFYALHIPAVAVILTSLCCAIVSIALSFRRQTHHFFSWTKCDRFVVYLALCDGLFNIVHACDHLQMLFTKDHVYPSELCQIYGFFIIVFISAQNLMVNVVSINIFMLMYFNKQLQFGQWDWKLLAWTFGFPVSGAVVAAILGQFGSTGAFCFFDGVKGTVGNIIFTTIPLLIILTMNIVLYTMTWTKIRREIKFIRENLGENLQSRKATLNAARSMSLFVVAFFIQWWSAGVYGAWGLFGSVSNGFFHAVTIFNNLGGVLNLIVFIFVRRMRSERKADNSSNQRSAKYHDSKTKDLQSTSDMPDLTKDSSVATLAYPD